MAVSHPGTETDLSGLSVYWFKNLPGKSSGSPSMQKGEDPVSSLRVASPSKQTLTGATVKGPFKIKKLTKYISVNAARFSRNTKQRTQGKWQSTRALCEYYKITETFHLKNSFLIYSFIYRLRTNGRDTIRQLSDDEVRGRGRERPRSLLSCYDRISPQGGKKGTSSKM